MTKRIQNRVRGANLDTLTSKQRVFVSELLASNSFSPKEAAVKAGYRHPAEAAYKLLKQKKIQAAVGRAQRLREERCALKADDVLDYLRFALFLNPLDYFSPGEDGSWILDDPKALPAEVGRLVASMDVKTIELKDGTTMSRVAVKLLDRNQILTLAMRHLGLLKNVIEVVEKVALDYDQIYRSDQAPRANGTDAECPIERRIQDAERGL